MSVVAELIWIKLQRAHKSDSEALDAACTQIASLEADKAELLKQVQVGLQYALGCSMLAPSKVVIDDLTELRAVIAKHQPKEES